MKKKDLLLSFLVFVLVLGLTIYVTLANNDINEIISDIKLINPICILVVVAILALYFLCEALYFKTMFKALKVKISTIKGYFYSIVEFFFSGITPGSTGGQPCQLYFMTRDKIPMRKSTITLILNTILFKSYLLFGGILILIFKRNYIYDYGTFVTVMFYLGLFWDVFSVSSCLLLMYNQKIIKFFLNIIFRIYHKFKKGENDIDKKVKDLLNNYVEEANFIKQHKKDIAIGTILTFLQRTLLFSIMFVLYKGFNLTGLNYFDLLMLQIFVAITVEMAFIPGGTGVNEYITHVMFVILFGAYASAGMVLTRALSFYLPLLLCMVLIIILYKILYSKKNNVEEK